VAVRIVLDTNVVVSALIWSGAPYSLLQAVIERDVTLYTSPVLIAELTEVLLRSHLTPRLERVRGSVEQALALYASLTTSVSPSTVSRVVTADPDDDHVLAAAVTAEADLIVSGDHHLLSLGNHQGIRVITPTDALRLILTER
jgi:uncharacterized protein